MFTQLNFYGFRKVKSDLCSVDNPVWEFRHPKFIKGMPHLLSDIKRAIHCGKFFSFWFSFIFHFVIFDDFFYFSLPFIIFHFFYSFLISFTHFSLNDSSIFFYSHNHPAVPTEASVVKETDIMKSNILELKEKLAQVDESILKLTRLVGAFMSSNSVAGQLVSKSTSSISASITGVKRSIDCIDSQHCHKSKKSSSQSAQAKETVANISDDHCGDDDEDSMYDLLSLCNDDNSQVLGGENGDFETFLAFTANYDKEQDNSVHVKEEWLGSDSSSNSNSSGKSNRSSSNGNMYSGSFNNFNTREGEVVHDVSPREGREYSSSAPVLPAVTMRDIPDIVSYVHPNMQVIIYLLCSFSMFVYNNLIMYFLIVYFYDS